MKDDQNHSLKESNKLVVPYYLPSSMEMSLADRQNIALLDEVVGSALHDSSSLEQPILIGKSDIDKKHPSGAMQLILRVGSASAKIISTDLRSKKCLVLCGPGNNGADGVALGRELNALGVRVSIVLVNRSRYSPELKELLEAQDKLEGASIPAYTVRSSSTETLKLGADLIRLNLISLTELGDLLKTNDLVVDCLLGTGQSGEPRGQIREIVEQVSANVDRTKLISIDIPTGVNGDTGEVYEPYICASATLAIQNIKRGLTQFPAREVVGELKRVDVGINFQAKPEFSLINQDIAKSWLVSRKPNCHKGDFGSVLVVAGSNSMPGAAILVCLGALHSGAGLVIKAEPKLDRYLPTPPEVIIKSLNCRDEFGEMAVEEISSLLQDVSSVVLGPGLGVSVNTERFVTELVRELDRRSINTVIDADALNILAKSPIKKLQQNVILTPHPKEAARLLKSDIKGIEQDRFAAVKKLQELYGGTFLLKGASTIIWDGKEGRVNTTGTPALATAGSGDVLAGLIGSLLARGYSPVKAASLGAFYHGKAGEQLSQETGGAITASALAPYLAVTSP